MAASCRRSPRAPMSNASTALIEEALAEAGLALGELDAIAATAGPGLIGGVMVGLIAGQGAGAGARQAADRDQPSRRPCADARGWPSEVDFPYLLLLVSGGHCQLLTVRGRRRLSRGSARRSTTRSAKRSTRPPSCSASAFPAGRRSSGWRKAAMRSASPCRGRWRRSRAATSPSPASRPRCGRPSRSSSRTIRAQRRYLRLVPARRRRRFGRPLRQRAARRAVADAGRRRRCGRQPLPARPAGRRCRRHGVRLVAPPVKLCTDNGAMIAWAGVERLRLGRTDALDFGRGRAGRSTRRPSAVRV